MKLVIGSGKNREVFSLPSIAAARQNDKMKAVLNNAITQVQKFVTGKVS